MLNFAFFFLGVAITLLGFLAYKMFTETKKPAKKVDKPIVKRLYDNDAEYVLTFSKIKPENFGNERW